MKPNPEHRSHLDRLAAKNRQIKLHRLEARERLEAMLEKEMTVLLVEQSQIANAALKAGVSKTRIGRAIGTSNWDTIKEVLRLAAVDEVETETTVETPRGWTYDPETMQVTVFEYEQRFTGKTITAEAEVLIPGEMQHTHEGYRIQPLRYPSDVGVQWINDVFDLIGQEQGMMNASPAPVRAPEPDDEDTASIEEQFWAQAGSENDDNEWDRE